MSSLLQQPKRILFMIVYWIQANNDEVFLKQFPGFSMAQMNEGLLVRSDIRKLLKLPRTKD
ncbi:hypothetical protein J437_LFUL015362 [Ladona fulva]|uniref:Uncharacterized protein n=1 Tax=Ladona fulva TaxID=123851 RepID=A0A8K0KG51_LADFU|nr:hypothetical protein J437_LFUL015362 [Ladona fulva]